MIATEESSPSTSGQTQSHNMNISSKNTIANKGTTVICHPQNEKKWNTIYNWWRNQYHSTSEPLLYQFRIRQGKYIIQACNRKGTYLQLCCQQKARLLLLVHSINLGHQVIHPTSMKDNKIPTADQTHSSGRTLKGGTHLSIRTITIQF